MILGDRILMRSAGAAEWNDISTANYDSKSFAVDTQDDFPTQFQIGNEGTKLYIFGAGNKTIYQYTLSTAWDISTASYDNKSFYINETVGPFIFNNSGDIVYFMFSNDTIYQYTLSTAWDISTASYDNKSFATGTQDNSMSQMYIRADGLRLFILGQSNDSAFQYTLSTAWDISTASYDNKSFGFSGTAGVGCHGLWFSESGRRCYVSEFYTNDAIFQYTLSTAWDISTASYDNKSFDVSIETGSPRNIIFKPDGSKFYLLSTESSNKFIYQYSL